MPLDFFRSLIHSTPCIDSDSHYHGVMKDTHIHRLQRGKASGIHIGSRSMPHHLHKFEELQLNLALERGYLLVKDRQRINVSNIYYLHCERLERPMIKVAMANGIAFVSLDSSTARNFDHKLLDSCPMESQGTFLFTKLFHDLGAAKSWAARLVSLVC